MGMLRKTWRAVRTATAPVRHGVGKWRSQSAIQRSAPLAPEDRVYRPHITVVRNARQFMTERLAQRVTTEWSGFELVESVSGPGGVTYVPLKQ